LGLFGCVGIVVANLLTAISLSEETQSKTDNVSAAAEEQAAELNEVTERANNLQRYASSSVTYSTASRTKPNTSSTSRSVRPAAVVWPARAKREKSKPPTPVSTRSVRGLFSVFDPNDR